MFRLVTLALILISIILFHQTRPVDNSSTTFSKLLHDIPDLNSKDDFDKVNAVRNWVALKIPIASNYANLSDTKKINVHDSTALDKNYSLIENHAGGLRCGGMSVMLKHLLNILGYTVFAVCLATPDPHH